MNLIHNVVIRKATHDDREEILDTAAEIFHQQRGQWLADRSWFRLAPEAFDPDGYWIAVAEGEIVGIAAFRPFMLRMPDVNLPWVGVGTVCTRPEWRGQGIMQGMLQKGIQETDERGGAISILWGDRRRYGWLGWERAGRQIDFTVSRRYFPDPGWDGSEVLKFVGNGRRTVVPEGLGERLTSIRTMYDNREPRPERDQIGLLSHPGCETYVVRREGKEAYVVVAPHIKRGARLYEAVGCPSLVADLLGYILPQMPTHLNATVSGSDLNDVEQMLLSRVSSMSVVPAGMVRIHDLARLLSYYREWWAKRHKSEWSGHVLLVMTEEDESGQQAVEQAVEIQWSPDFVQVTPVKPGERSDNAVVVSVDRRQMTQLLFGPLPIEIVLPHNPDAWILKDIFPLPLSVPHLEKV